MAARDDCPSLLPAAPRRAPALPVAVAVCLGIALDRLFSIPVAATLVACAAGLLSWGVFEWRRSVRAAGLCLLTVWLLVGAARHHVAWSRSETDVSRYATNDGEPVRLRARIVSEPWIRPPRDEVGFVVPPERGACDVACLELGSLDETQPVTGRARLYVEGHLLHAHVGDVVEVYGSLARTTGPGNPGEFDYRAWLRRQGIEAVVFVDGPEAIEVARPAPFPLVWRMIADLRETGRRVLVRHLSERTRPIASAILLGDRSGLTDELRDDFAESGTMHLLAISGLHVGILAVFVWLLCRMLGLPVRSTSIVVMLGVILYAAVTDARPSVVRAAVFVIVYSIGRAIHRQTSALNVVAVSALILLLWNPADLFDTGAQLSFLAVLGIGCGEAWRRGRERERSSLDRLLAESERNAIARLTRTAGRWLFRTYAVVAFIWLFTAPLVAARFHLVSPVGLIVNGLLVPFAAVVLWCGYLLLLLGLLAPGLAWPFALGFEGGLRFLLWVVEVAAGWRVGHYYVPAPPEWWLIGYYVALGAMLVLPSHRRGRTAGWLAVGSWTAAGLLVGLLPAAPEGLRCTFLDVGHGNAVLVECPNGRTLLYDAGSLRNSRYAARVVQSALLARGHSRLDAVVVSHADVDHFNALPRLVERFPVGRVFVSRQFLDFEQPAVAELCESMARSGTRIALVQAGDALRLDDAARLEFVHPRIGFEPGEDNEASLVAEVGSAGRVVLLTGDVERAGQSALLEGKRRDCDVLLAPHHGSRAANGDSFAEWAAPELVVVSSGRRTNVKALQTVYATSRVLWTHRDGAVTVAVDRQGRLQATAWRRDE